VLPGVCLPSGFLSAPLEQARGAIFEGCRAVREVAFFAKARPRNGPNSKPSRRNWREAMTGTACLGRSNEPGRVQLNSECCSQVISDVLGPMYLIQTTWP
jgi:hypothetical protein